MKAVTYPNLGWETAAALYLPPSFDEGREYPAIVSTHPMGSCKEQTAGNVYAKGLAQEGFRRAGARRELPGRQRRHAALH